MLRFVPRMVGVALVVLICSASNLVSAMAPNPLESAYWRFEEGQNGNVVPTSAVDPDGSGDAYGDGDFDPVLDSINDNNLRNAAGSPTYTTETAPTALKSGAANNLAMSFSPNSALGTFLRNVDNGTIDPGNGFTVEAAFKPNAVVFPGPYRGILAKGGEPSDGVGGDIVGNLPTAALKIRGDTGLLMFEQFDTDKNLTSVSSQSPLIGNNWYYAAVVNTGSTLSLYLDSNDGNGYQLQSTIGVSGAIYMGDPNNPDQTHGYPSWSHGWSVGRGYFAGAADWFDGIIDEVRISNSALEPSDFLFAPGLGDFNADQFVDAADYVAWRKTNSADADAYNLWRQTFGTSLQGAGGSSSVPEPNCLLLAAFAIFAATPMRKPGRRVFV